VGAGGPQHIRLDRRRHKVALPLEDRGDHEAVGLEGAGWAEGQDGVALFDGQVQPAEEAVSDAVAAAEDDPPPPRAQHQQTA
jgi:hypothetical protein